VQQGPGQHAGATLAGVTVDVVTFSDFRLSPQHEAPVWQQLLVVLQQSAWALVWAELASALRVESAVIPAVNNKTLTLMIYSP
jgi:hypothetical protein